MTALFDTIPRSELRPKYDSESDFEYHNRSARPGVVASRALMEEWFARYPDAHKRDLRGRFRSRSQSAHFGAFFELYLHELLLRMGCSVQVHPEIAHTRSHPDFLVVDPGGIRLYVEATLASAPGNKDEAAGRRTGVVYDCLNEMDSPNFFLGVRAVGSASSPPSAALLRRDLQNWLSSLDPDHIAELYQTARRAEVPRYSWRHDGWDLEFEPIPKSTSSRGKPGIRSLGTRMGDARWLNTAAEIRTAVRLKARKYGRLELPLVLCINVLEHIDEIDVLGALVGDEQTVITFGEDDRILGQHPTRAPNGVFGVEGHPRTQRVSAIAVAASISPWTMGKVTPELFHHPWPYVGLPVSFWPMPQWVANHESRRIERVNGVRAASLLELPDPWPTSLD